MTKNKINCLTVKIIFFSLVNLLFQTLKRHGQDFCQNWFFFSNFNAYNTSLHVQHFNGQPKFECHSSSHISEIYSEIYRTHNSLVHVCKQLRSCFSLRIECWKENSSYRPKINMTLEIVSWCSKWISRKISFKK